MSRTTEPASKYLEMHQQQEAAAADGHMDALEESSFCIRASSSDAISIGSSPGEVREISLLRLPVSTSYG